MRMDLLSTCTDFQFRWVILLYMTLEGLKKVWVPMNLCLSWRVLGAIFFLFSHTSCFSGIDLNWHLHSALYLKDYVDYHIPCVMVYLCSRCSKASDVNYGDIDADFITFHESNFCNFT